jgi:hypothetical protein
MLLKSLRSLCLAPGGPVSIWKDSGALVRMTGMSERFTHDFQTILHFATHSPENDTSKFTLHILPDTPAEIQ